MALSSFTAIGDGSNKTFTLSFALGYISTANVKCRVGSETDGTGAPAYRTLTYTSANIVTLSGAAPGVGVPVVFTRTVPKTSMAVNFADGAALTGSNLDTALKQTMMIAHEALDGVGAQIGPKGDKGDTGATGLQGPKGDTGSPGATGPKGDTGNTGAQGIKGDKGDTGAQGLQGPQGPIGATGANGAQGPAGPTGSQGQQGIQGPKGDPGPVNTSSVSKSGDTMTGVLSVQNTGYFGNSAEQYPFAIGTNESGHSSGSKRTMINIGYGWQFGQDFNANGNRSFYLYNIQAGSIAYTVDIGSSVVDFKSVPTVNGVPLAGGGGFVGKAGDTMTGPLAAGDVSLMYPYGFLARESTHSSGSKRAAIVMGSRWTLLQDSAGNGSKDYGLFDNEKGLVAYQVTTDTVVNFAKKPTVSGVPIWDSIADYPKASKNILFRQKKYLLSDYGLVSRNGDTQVKTNNVLAWNALVNDIVYENFGGTIILPDDVFYFNSMLAGNFSCGVTVEGAGRNSTAFFSDSTSAGAIQLHNNGNFNGNRMSLRNLRVIARNCSGMTNSGRLVSVRGCGSPGSVNVEDIDIDCDNTSRASEYLTVCNPVQSCIRNITVEGAQAAYGVFGIGMNVYSDISPATDFAAYNCWMTRVGIGFRTTHGQLQPNNYSLEGATFADCGVIGAQTGLEMVSGFYKAPGYVWRNGHVNAQKYCFNLQNMSHFKIDGANAQLDINNSPGCIAFLNNCVGIQVVNNNFGIVNQLGTGIATPDVAGIVAAGNTAGCQITGNYFGGFTANSAMVWNQGSATLIRAGHNMKHGGGGVALTGTVIDLGGNNTY